MIPSPMIFTFSTSIPVMIEANVGEALPSHEESSKMLPSFGVDPESIKDRPNGDYWKWYHFWKTWMESFSNDGWREFESKYEKDENIEDLLPKTKWNDPVEGPAPAKKEEKKE